MKPVMQTQIGENENSLRASIASLLELDTIPEWLNVETSVLNDKLREYVNKNYVQYDYYHDYNNPLPKKLWKTAICTATFHDSQDVNFYHTVVYDRIKQVVLHDPHPKKIFTDCRGYWEPYTIGFLVDPK